MLTAERTVLVVIDFQGNLAQAMADRDALLENARKMIQGIQVFDIPLIVTEQIPAKLVDDPRNLKSPAWGDAHCQGKLQLLPERRLYAGSEEDGV